MKKPMNIFALLSSLIVFVGTGFAEEIYELPNVGKKREKSLVTKSVKIKEIFVAMNEAGRAVVTMSEYRETTLSVENVTTGVVTLMQAYPTNDVLSEFSAMLPDLQLLSFELSQNPAMSAVVFEYALNRGGGKADETDSFLQMFVLGSSEEIISVGTPIKIAESNVVLYRNDNKELVYRYFAVDSGNPPRPAFRSNTKVLIRDANKDGFKDIVLWTRKLESAEVGGKEFNFVLKEEGVTVMYFDPFSRNFSPPVAEKNLSIPAKELWRSLPTVNDFVGIEYQPE